MKETNLDAVNAQKMLNQEQYKEFLRTRTYKHNCEILRKCCPLSILQKVVVALHWFEKKGKGYSFAQISDILGIHRSKVVRLHKKAIAQYTLWYNRRGTKQQGG